MSASKQTDSQTTRSLQWCALLSVLYICLIFIMPVNHVTYINHVLTPLQYRFAMAAIAIPTILVWFVAFFGYAKLREYSLKIPESKEGPHFNKLANGCMWLAWSLPVIIISSYFLNHIATRTASFHPTAIIVSNYLALIVPLVAFIIISAAAGGMVSSARPNLNLVSARLTMLAFLATGVAYCFAVFRNLDLASLTSPHNPYYLPVWLMILTIIIPYLYAWFIGLFAVYEITLFTLKVRGLLYRQALLSVAIGLVVIIISSIALQYINSVIPRSGILVFDYRLSLTLLFRIIGGVGFIILATGANRLKKIEEV